MIHTINTRNDDKTFEIEMGQSDIKLLYEVLDYYISKKGKNDLEKERIKRTIQIMNKLKYISGYFGP